MKILFFSTILSFGIVHAQVENKTIETQFDLNSAIESRAIESRATIPGEILLKDKSTSTFTSFSKKVEAGNLTCELTVTTLEKDLDYVQIKTQVGWESKEIKSTFLVKAQDAIIQRATISLSLARPESKSIILSCEKEIGKTIEFVSRCSEGLYDTKLFATPFKILACKGSTKPMTFNELTQSVFTHLGIDIDFNTIIKTNYRVLTVQAGEIPAG